VTELVEATDEALFSSMDNAGIFLTGIAIYKINFYRKQELEHNLGCNLHADGSFGDYVL
jgi:hypothetical protein